MLARLPTFLIVLMVGVLTHQATASTLTPLVTPNLPAASTSSIPPLITPQSFTDWRADLRMQALSEGISPLLFEQAFAGLTPDPQVIAADQSQPEFSRPVWEYLESAVSSWRVARGKALLAEHAQTLKAIEAQYQVEPSVLVAVWGMESSFGRQIGSKNVIRSLATLAYEGRRNDFWRSQLLAALHILQEGDTSLNGMIGSWAGANMQLTLTVMVVVISGNQVLTRWRLRRIIYVYPAGNRVNLGGLKLSYLRVVLIMPLPMAYKAKRLSNGLL